MRAGDVSNQLRMAEPLFVSAAFELSHGRERIEFVRKAARERIFRNPVDKSQKRGQPRFHKNHAALFPKNAPHLRESLFEIIRKRGQMVQTSLDDENVLGLVRERQFPAVGDNAFSAPVIPGDQAGRQIHALDARKSQMFERMEPVSAPAEKFDDFGILRPFARAEFVQTAKKLPNFLLRCFKAQIRGFPRIGRHGTFFGGIRKFSQFFH